MKYSSSRIQHEFRFVNVIDLIEMTGFGRLVPKPMHGFIPSWTILQKSRVIEMIILGLPTETIWGEQDPLGRTQILSAFDIFSAILDFSENRFNLRELKVLKHLNGLYYRDLNYAEKKHFEQMGMQLGVILYDSDPMLKCLFIENINRNSYGKYAAQLARNINFKIASEFIEKHSTHLIWHFTQLKNSKQLRYTTLQLKLQSDILYCFLIYYLSRDYKYRIPELSMESYSYSRSHISNYSDYNNIEISMIDDLDIALNKIMFMIDVNHQNLHNITYDFNSILDKIVLNEEIYPDSFGSAEIFLSGKEIKSPGLINYIAYYCFKKPIKLMSFTSRMTTINNLMEWATND
ncbi:hypothetical protein VLC34_001774 [Salmonella enterica]|uniref:hypothetical protein n=1 Tax=Klebsiella TaxID=570 RepID=UPI0012804B59|nr:MULTISPECIES: hypothetical protein [Klebsiella]EBJ3505327.1 hypothetical protein [Salmonella enterica]ECF7019545.1 hypothetical protein [Salmonella enterica subsp. arizonae]ECG0938627.1 hypothetical protein [Salmonella enterica subsp. salamae]ECI8172268.1 hypothetical protein [Salmonella enterica subsp. arizonae]EED9355016.1 hypothetical protein [Salmonella enterica subsp. arizonae]